MDEARRRQLEVLAGGGGTPVAPQPEGMPGQLPPEIEAIIRQAPGTPGGLRSMSPRGGTVNAPVPAATAQAEMRRKMLEQLAGNKLEEDSAVNKQLLKKAADQKLQLQQALTIFNKIYDEADRDIPPIQKPEGTLPAQKLGRYAGRELGLREKQRGSIESFQARATPALKALGEVGVLTDQDIQRILQGGFPSDYDSDTTRATKRQGLITDFQSKLDQVNKVLGVEDQGGVTPSGLKYTYED